MDAEQQELAELLYEEELADQEVAQAVASMQHAESSGGRPAAPVMQIDREDSETPVVSRVPYIYSARKPDDEVISEYYLRMIRRKLYEFYTFKKEVPTVDKLLRVLKREVNFSCSRNALVKVLRKEGFRLGGRQEVIRMPIADGHHPTVLFCRDNKL